MTQTYGTTFVHTLRGYCEASNFMKNVCAYASTSTIVANHLPPKSTFNSGNKKKSEGARSGVYTGWGKIFGTLKNVITSCISQLDAHKVVTPL